MYKFDIKDYYMSGSHSVLASHASKSAERPYDFAVERLVRSMLQEQLVECDEHTWRVVRVAGMGLSMAGHVADIVFSRG